MLKGSISEVLLNMSNMPTFEGIQLNGPNVQGHFGDYPIHVAVVQGDLESIRILVLGGADINVRGEHGYTPLHEAIEQGNADAVQVLIDLGADKSIRNLDGLSPRELAIDLEEKYIINILD